MNKLLINLKQEFNIGELSKPDFINKALEIHKALFNYIEIIKTTDIKEISISSDGVLFLLKDEGIRLFCPENESRVVPIEIMNFSHYEPDESRVMNVLIGESKNILDIGANIGFYSIQFAKKRPESKIFSFEPIPNSYNFLQRNIAENQVGHLVTPFNYGLSETGGIVNFFISPTSGTNASLKNVAQANDAVSITGLTLMLDQWVENQNIIPDFIKCDVEGAELLVFRGGIKTISKHKPIIFTELLRKWSKPFGYHPNDVIKFFDELGYQCFAIGSGRNRLINEVNNGTIETNYAFLHKISHVEMIKKMEYLK